MPKAIIDQAMDHFFAAMLRGWAAGVEGIPMRDMPGYKQTPRYERDGFRVLDFYGISMQGRSEGTTRIWYLGKPIWVMNYGGLYRKEDVPFLKVALMEAYHERIFVGGRGLPRKVLPEAGSGKGLLYTNDVSVNSSFLDFHGQERITSIGETRLVGHHYYSGMALIDPYLQSG